MPIKRSKQITPSIATMLLDDFMTSISSVPKDMLHRESCSGVYLGTTSVLGREYDVVKPLEVDGHFVGLGGSGSGKTSSIVIPTLKNCKDPIFAIDVNGELYSAYLKNRSLNKRPAKVLNLTSDKGSFQTIDPLHFFKLYEENRVQYCRELVQCMMPLPHDVAEPFWIESAQLIITGIMLHYFEEGCEFNEILERIAKIPLLEQIQRIDNGKSDTAKMLVAQFYTNNGDISDNKMILSIATTIITRLIAFATDPVVKAAFTQSTDSFNWSDLKTHNIFIRVEQAKLEQLGPVITMLITQFVRYLERQPNKYTPEGRRMKPVLLLLDEFARIGKMDVIAGALATLRIKKVTIAIFVQSLSQLNLRYGKDQSKVIMDNCSYLAVLSVNDPDTQEYVSKRIGDHKVHKASHTYTRNEDGNKYKSSTYSYQYEPKVRPATLSNPKNIKFIFPGGFCTIKKKPITVASISSLFDEYRRSFLL